MITPKQERALVNEVAAPEPYQYLPLYVRLAIEWLDNHYEERTRAKLEEMIALYASTYPGTNPNEYIESASHYCARRFPNYA